MSRSPKQTDLWDAIIVGGGPAGLNAALVLGRCRRKVLLFDDGRPRNAVSHALHGFLSRDGVAPAQLRAIAREQLAAYASVVVDEARGGRQQHSQASFDIVFESRPLLRRAGIFFSTESRQSTDLAARLGCDTYSPKGCTVNNDQQMTHVPGLYVAGDSSRDVLQAIIAAAEGAKAAIGINTALLHEDLA